MKLIVVSAPEAIKDEIALITTFFELGMDIFHLRKPGFSEADTEDFFDNLPVEYHSKVVPHAHHHLIEKYNFGGIHFTKKHFQWSASRMKTFSSLMRPREGKTVSASLHSLQEVEDQAPNYDYLFLSPVFDSITKENYKAGFDMNEVRLFLSGYKKNPQNKASVIALGGIKADNIMKVFEAGFDGAAIYGALWTLDKTEDIIKTFVKLNDYCRKLSPAAETE